MPSILDIDVYELSRHKRIELMRALLDSVADVPFDPSLSEQVAELKRCLAAIDAGEIKIEP